MDGFPRITSRALYIGLAGVVCINVAWLIVSPADIEIGKLDDVLAPPLLLLGVLLLLRRFHQGLPLSDRRIGQIHVSLDALFFLQIAWLNLRLLNHLSMTIGFAFADDILAGWDRALGFNWLAYFDWVHRHPDLISLLDLAYFSLTPLSTVAILALIALHRYNEAQNLILTFSICALVCMLIGSLFPARAAVLHYIADFSVYPNFSKPPGTYHMRHLQALRDPTAAVIVLNPLKLPGLVTFPSFHTAAGLLLVAAFRRTFLAVPVLVYAIAMIASTPVFGSHYFVDLIAGATIAVLAIGCVEHLNGKRNDVIAQ